MYRPQQTNSSRAIRTLILLGILVGVVFFLYDNYRNVETEIPTTESPVTQPTQRPPTATPPVQATVSSQLGPAPDTTIFIPSAAIYAPVITSYLTTTTWDITGLGTNVGYLEGTAWLGETGNIVLSGHVEMSDGHAGIFAELNTVAIGDEIVLQENGVTYVYRVREIKEVEPTDLTPLYSTREEQLTLVTCSDYNFIDDTYETRLIVIADRIPA
jgi:LPXTG-site transpeptidase (sortase) family protein